MAGAERIRTGHERDSRPDWPSFSIGEARNSTSEGASGPQPASSISNHLASFCAEAGHDLRSRPISQGQPGLLPSVPQDGMRPLGCINPNCCDRSKARHEAPGTTEAARDPETEAGEAEGEIAYRPSVTRIALAVLAMVACGVIVIGWLYWVGME